MRSLIANILNIIGVVLLLAAALLAWQFYNPVLPPIPADVTVITQVTPVTLAPQATSTPSPQPATTPTPSPSPEPTTTPTAQPAPQSAPPVLLPESKPQGTAAPADPQPTVGADASTPQPTAAPTTGTDASAPQPTTAPTVGADGRPPQPTATPTTGTDAPAPQPTPAPKSTFPPAAHSVPARIELPTIHVDSPVVEVGWKTIEQGGQPVSEWEVADFAVSFHKTAALPGAIGNTVMSGHNNINGEVFRNLLDLKIGDDIVVYADDVAYHYHVEQKLLLKERDMPLDVRIQNANWIAPTDDVRLTLVSCWPYTNNTHRVIIVAKPAP